MKRTSLNFLIDAIALVAFAVIVSTGFLLRYVLPSGSGQLEGSGTGWRAAQKAVSLLWGYTCHQWGEFHFWVSVVLVAVLALHVVLHWRWIISVVRGRRPREGSGARFALGVVGLVSLAILCVAPFFGEKQQVPRAVLRPTEAGVPPTEAPAESPSHLIQGSMTLREVEQETGVPVSYLVEKLGLPPGTSPDEHLGRLRRTFGLQIEDVRRITAEYETSEP